MTNVRGRSEETPATEDASEGSATAMTARSVVEAQLAAQRILERGQRRKHGQVVGVAEGGVTPVLALHRDELAREACTTSPPPPEEFMALFHEYERYVASIGSRILGAN